MHYTYVHLLSLETLFNYVLGYISGDGYFDFTKVLSIFVSCAHYKLTLAPSKHLTDHLWRQCFSMRLNGAVIDFTRPILTSKVDPLTVRVHICIMAVYPQHKYSNEGIYGDFKLTKILCLSRFHKNKSSASYTSRVFEVFRFDDLFDDL